MQLFIMKKWQRSFPNHFTAISRFPQK